MEQKQKALSCSFCGKNQEEVRKLIAGPAVYICDECVDICKEVIINSQDGKKHCETVYKQDRKEKLNCSFCGKKQKDIRHIFISGNFCICNECLELCNDIFEDEDRRDREAQSKNKKNGDEKAEEALNRECSLCGNKEYANGMRQIQGLEDYHICCTCLLKCEVIMNINTEHKLFHIHNNEFCTVEQPVICTTCGKTTAEVPKMIASHTLYICDDCIRPLFFNTFKKIIPPAGKGEFQEVQDN